MFFSTYVLTKKGPLAKVWLAAHWDRKLTRNEVKVVNLRETIIHIIRPIVPIAIRTSGELLIGVVRIYALKVKHLLREATEATLHLLMAGMAAKNGLALEKKDAGNKALPANRANVNAVTHEWGGANHHPSDGENPSAVNGSDAPFNEIADLLGGLTSGMGGMHASNDGDDEEHLLRSAWYAVEPVLQHDSHNTQEDLDDIARMRADLIAFGEQRADSGSNSNSSKSKSSLSSIEQARGSHLLDEGVPFLPVTDDLDIGAPLPDELPMGVSSVYPGGADLYAEDEDPFFIPELLPPGGLGQTMVGTTSDENNNTNNNNTTTATALPKKVRLVNVLDLHATTLPREVVEKNIADRSDILERYGARHGAGNEEERRDRFTVVGGVWASSGSSSTTAGLSASGSHNGSSNHTKKNGAGLLQDALLFPLSPSLMVSPLLRERFHAAISTAAASLAPQQPSDQAFADENEEFALGGGGMPVEELQSTTTPLHDGNTARGVKRSREERDENGALSRNAAATLEKIKELLDGRRRKARRTDGHSAADSPSCSFEELCENTGRREVARTFVDVLSLLSKQYITVEQQRALGPLVVRLESGI